MPPVIVQSTSGSEKIAAEARSADVGTTYEPRKLPVVVGMVCDVTLDCWSDSGGAGVSIAQPVNDRAASPNKVIRMLTPMLRAWGAAGGPALARARYRSCAWQGE